MPAFVLLLTIPLLLVASGAWKLLSWLDVQGRARPLARQRAAAPTADGAQGLVATVGGLVAGSSLPSMPWVHRAFLGLPYAAPPVGERRWQPPGPPPSWAPLVFAADSPGPPCIGKPTPGVKLEDMHEDCLRLDVYTPRLRHSQERPVPVMVFLHGGSLVEGSSSSIQSGFGAVANVTRLGVISVAVNYRLAVLGFLALHATAASDERGGGAAGNYGLLDCVAALRWVHANVAAFGGDPDRVTVYGQSSGGSLVLALAASPLAGGLFWAGVSMSGSPRLSATFEEAAASWHPAVVHRSRCAPLAAFDAPRRSSGRDALLKCLHSLNKNELIESMPKDWDSASFSFSAFSPDFRYAPLLVIDGSDAVRSDYLTAFARPHPDSPIALGATLVLGVTREEIDFAPGDDARTWSLDRFRGFVARALDNFSNQSLADQVILAYGLQQQKTQQQKLEQQQVYAQIVSDATIYCPTLVLADAVREGIIRSRATKREPQLYVYSTSQTPGHEGGFCPLRPFQSIPGYCPQYAFHAVDMFALFAPQWSSVESQGLPGYSYTEEDLAYGRLLRRRLLELSHGGSVAAWHTYGRGPVGGYSAVDLRWPGEANVGGLRQEQCALWRPFYARLGLIN